MSQLEGLPISTGFAAGTAVICDYEIERRLATPRRHVSSGDIATEHDRLQKAVEHSHGELQKGRNCADFGSDPFDVDTLLAAHARMVNEVAAIVRCRVSEEFVNIEHALDAVISEFVERLSQLESNYFREPEQDVRDVGRRMMRTSRVRSQCPTRSCRPIRSSSRANCSHPKRSRLLNRDWQQLSSNTAVGTAIPQFLHGFWGFRRWLAFPTSRQESFPANTCSSTAKREGQSWPPVSRKGITSTFASQRSDNEHIHSCRTRLGVYMND